MPYKYFKDSELSCSHCNILMMNDEFMVLLEVIREECGFPFIVTSAYRCTQHPIEAKKTNVGAHTTGKAVDIAVNGENAYKLVQIALKHDMEGIGISQKGDMNSRFIHLDTAGLTRSRPRIWSY
jgi:zinc D-Ala-D-Ala carboxypeptidase